MNIIHVNTVFLLSQSSFELELLFFFFLSKYFFEDATGDPFE